MKVWEDLLNAYIEQSEDCELWDCELEETVYSGVIEDVYYTKYANMKVGSFGIENGILVVNIY